MALALIDIDIKRLPDAIVLPSYLVRAACCSARRSLVDGGLVAARPGR